MKGIPQNIFYRGVREFDEADPLRSHADGPVFFTDNPEEAATYGDTVVSVELSTSNLFGARLLLDRSAGEWEAARAVQDIELSAEFLGYLSSVFGEETAEQVYFYVQRGSWSEIERPEVQESIRARGFDGFLCWEGDGLTCGLFDIAHVRLVEWERRSSTAADNSPELKA